MSPLFETRLGFLLGFLKRVVLMNSKKKTEESLEFVWPLGVKHFIGDHLNGTNWIKGEPWFG